MEGGGCDVANAGERPSGARSASLLPGTLLSVSHKFVKAIFDFRLWTNVERFQILLKSQESFVREKRARMSLQSFAWRLQHLRDKKLQALILFLDWSAALDSILLKALWHGLQG